MMTNRFDAIVIGAGSGGLSTAIRAGRHGAKVALVDPGELGGTCVNVGCVPKKVMWLAARMAESQRTAAAVGFDVRPGTLDWSAFVARRQAYIERIHASYRQQLDDLGVHRVSARARLLGAGRVDAGGEVFEAPHIVIATGARSRVPALPGAELGGTSDDFFDWREAPRRVALIGGGYIAVELAGVLHALGSDVSIVLRRDHLLDAFDRECADHATALYEAHGIRIVRGVDVTALERSHDGVRIVGSGAPSQGFDKVLWATGRQPNSEGIGLDVAGVRCDARGHVIVDDCHATSASGIHAVGDVTTDPALTPVAVKAGRLLADRLFGGCPDARLDRSLVPTVVFGHPPLASVGLTEAAAVERHGDAVKVYRTRFRPMLCALLDGDDRTLMKLICVGPEERVVGLHMVGPDVDEIVQGFALALKLGACKRDFDATIAVHPTAAEEVVLMR